MLNKTFMEAYYDAYNSGDKQALSRFYAEDIVLVSAQGEIKGRAALLATYDWITGQMLDQMTPESILIDGRRAAVEINDTFTAKRAVSDFLGRALREGESFSMRLCGLYTLGDDGFEHIVLYQR